MARAPVGFLLHERQPAEALIPSVDRVFGVRTRRVRTERRAFLASDGEQDGLVLDVDHFKMVARAEREFAYGLHCSPCRNDRIPRRLLTAQPNVGPFCRPHLARADANALDAAIRGDANQVYARFVFQMSRCSRHWPLIFFQTTTNFTTAVPLVMVSVASPTS